MIEFDDSANEPAEPHDVMFDSQMYGDPPTYRIDGGFTKREDACIRLLYPDSGLDWLDEMIRARKREEMARALIGNASLVVSANNGDVESLIADAVNAVLPTSDTK